ncbi:MAG: SDR family NAD(P)-dependent oxidoreductase [Promethearchaeota archaeon]
MNDVSAKRLKGKVILVSGAGSGIGRASAIRFAKEGAKIIINDINEDGARETANIIQDLGQENAIYIADVTSSEQVQKLVKDIYSNFDALDVLMNNAGVGGSMSRVVSMPEETWDRIIRINLKSVFLMSKYFAKKMIKRKCDDQALRGKIINVASARGLKGRAMFGAYSASKAGVVSLTQTLALELGKYRITVNAICPGLIHTPIYGNISYDNLAGTNPIPAPLKYKPVGVADDVAGIAFFLASDDSNWMTGQSIPVTGGRLIH